MLICLHKVKLFQVFLIINGHKSEVKLATVVEGDPKAPFWIATTLGHWRTL